MITDRAFLVRLLFNKLSQELSQTHETTTNEKGEATKDVLTYTFTDTSRRLRVTLEAF